MVLLPRHTQAVSRVRPAVRSFRLLRVRVLLGPKLSIIDTAMSTATDIFYVYEHWRLDRDECFYVGKGKGGRAYSAKRNKLWQNIVAKLERIGSAFEVRIVASGLSEQEAYSLEKERIAFWRDKVTLANFTLGGEGWTGGRHSEEFKKKISVRHKGRVVSQETREKISKVNTGNPRLIASKIGFKHSEESKKLMSEKFKGRQKSEEHKKKLAEANRGKKMTLEMKAILIATNIGRKPSEETRKKLSAAQKGRIITKEHRQKISDTLRRRHLEKNQIILEDVNG